MNSSNLSAFKCDGAQEALALSVGTLRGREVGRLAGLLLSSAACGLPGGISHSPGGGPPFLSFTVVSSWAEFVGMGGSPALIPDAFMQLSSLTGRSLGVRSPASVLHQLLACRPRVRWPLLSGTRCVTGP